MLSSATTLSAPMPSMITMTLFRILRIVLWTVAFYLSATVITCVFA